MNIETLEMPQNTSPRFPFVPGETVVVVSGLPRSGTSLMMQMLQAGGIDPLTDGTRSADASNLKGYLELDAVRTLRKDNTWMEDAKGKAIKVISNLLPSVKSGMRYKVIFMWRDLREVLRSQQVMLEHSGHSARQDPAQLGRAFARQLRLTVAWLQGQEEIDVLYVDYGQAVAKPSATAEAVNKFLGDQLDTSRMAGTVAPELHRQKVLEAEGNVAFSDQIQIAAGSVQGIFTSLHPGSTEKQV